MYCFLTQAGEAEASRGQDLKANGAAERWSRGGQRTAAVTAGDWYTTALQTQQITPGLVHVQSVPLHTLHYHWLTAHRKRDLEFRNHLLSTSRRYILGPCKSHTVFVWCHSKNNNNSRDQQNKFYQQ